jgi:hypothetical protein
VDEVARLVVSWGITTALIFVIVLRDEKRLPPEKIDRAWPPASRASAVIAFGVLCLPVYFGRTRRSFGGVLLGVGWLVALSVLDVVVEALVLLAFGVSPSGLADRLW